MRYILSLIVVCMFSNLAKAGDFKAAYDEQSKPFFWGTVGSSAIFLLPRANKESNLGWMDNSFDRYFTRFERDRQVSDLGPWYSKASLPLTLAPFLVSYLKQVDRKNSYIEMLHYLQMLALHNGIKGVTRQFFKRERPDKTDTNAFPSGHTSHMFIAAHFLSEKYSGNIFHSLAYYTTAAVFSFTRIIDRKHRMTDILAGAMLGVLSSELVFNYYDSKNTLAILPEIYDGGYGLSLRYIF